MKTSEFLRKTAKHIKRVGLNQNGNYYDKSKSENTEDCPACIVGAMNIIGEKLSASEAHWHQSDARRALSSDLRKRWAAPCIFSFSDNAKSEATVTRRLEKVARDLESEGQ